ncbi:hypothetical protein PVA45_01150 [Entomospira entomophila]|uniref:Tetratricopeptide repeat protein n=1 Tax=Entomospira entomophila TaxID=2719988 RepID=A0A968KVR8_9SPIO|nr:hypothetical protein [Entomospira entomophilus]NIZ40125.1 hypothetical protein [Entomospira entomophilus]WDI35684.1 hypothetical protein PVA45_01150 [Entomospira entomophilus]
MAGNEELNTLKNILEDLSNEPRWREQRGEAIEDVVIENAPVIERESIVREADLNREDADTAYKEEGSQMDDEEKEVKLSAETANLEEQFEHMSDDLSAIDDPGIDNLQHDDLLNDIDFSDLDGVTLDDMDDLGKDLMHAEELDSALSADDIDTATEPSVIPVSEEGVQDEALDVTTGLDPIDDLATLSDELPNLDEPMSLMDSAEELSSLEVDNDALQNNAFAEDNISSDDTDSDNQEDASLDGLALPDLDQPLEMFDTNSDEDTLFAMGEADELEDLQNSSSEVPEESGVYAVDLLMENEIPEERVSDESLDIDFNIGDFGGISPDQEKSKEQEEDDEEEEDAEEEENDAESLIFSQEKIHKINESLARFPRNLRLALHKILANEETSPEDIVRLTQKLLKNASARAMANEVREITGQTIILPSRYQQNAGEDFEKRKHGFVYNFSQFAWPPLRAFMVATVMVALLFFTVFSFLYRPLTASHYYRTGYDYILDNDYDRALLNFGVAHDGWRLGPLHVQGWPMQRWFFKYAEAFSGQRQYTQAQEMYSRLLLVYPTSRRAFLEYGDFESRRRANFERADQIYLQYLNDVNSKDAEVLTARSTNLLRWGAHDASRLAQARDVYATLIASNGVSDRTMMGLLEFAVLTNDRAEIEMWTGVIHAKSRLELDPEILVLTAGWYLDQGRASDAEQLLQKAVFLSDRDPILHYQLARFYEQSNDLFNARKSLEEAIYLIQKSQPMTRQDTEVFIDIFRRSSHLRFEENILDERAQSELERAIAYYENGVERRIIGRNAFHGGMYKELGDIFYIRDRALRLANINYTKALENKFDDADLRYKRGFIAYEHNDIMNAINEFSLSHEMASGFKNTAFSLATVMAVDGRYSTAEAFYQELRGTLEAERSALLSGDSSAELLLRKENGEYLMKVYNNLGVVLNRLAQQRPNRAELQQQAQIAFQQSMFLWDALSRDVETRARVISQELPGMNFRELLHPTTQGEANNLYDALPPFIDNPPVAWGF